MKLPKSIVTIIGVITFLPMIAFLGSMAFVLFEILSLFFSETPFNPFLYLSYLGYVAPVLSMYSFIYLALLIIYFAHTFNNKRLDTEKKLLWLSVLIILHGISMPFYWYFHMWRNPTETNEINLHGGRNLL